ncbi:hypothetical protein K440DRAFT_251670 [Wilcoxina mikolae CBS 423.85]|nr:hypothetical protein K440DRAFT_251670 [Wilcoxina mikolae CBS 423.85]
MRMRRALFFNLIAITTARREENGFGRHTADVEGGRVWCRVLRGAQEAPAETPHSQPTLASPPARFFQHHRRIHPFSLSALLISRAHDCTSNSGRMIRPA